MQAYLYRSAHNAFVNAIRARKPETSLDVLVESGFQIPHDAADADLKEQQQEAVAALNHIEEPYREVLVLRYVSGLKVKEIAQLLGVGENTVSVRIHRGLRKLRERYTNEE